MRGNDLGFSESFCRSDVIVLTTVGFMTSPCKAGLSKLTLDLLTPQALTGFDVKSPKLTTRCRFHICTLLYLEGK